MAAAGSGPPTIEGEIVGEIAAVEQSLRAAGERIEELVFWLKDGKVSQEVSWLVRGWLDDVLLDLGDMTDNLLKLKSELLGGLTDKDVEWLREVGGEFR